MLGICVRERQEKILTWSQAQYQTRGGGGRTGVAREAVDAPSLEVFQARLDKTLSNLV